MATLNGYYVFVTDESLNRSTKIPQHPVEKGLPLTDSVRSEPKTLSISGKIVNTEKDEASDIIAQIEKLRTSGSLIKYIGRNTAGNFMIKSFDTSHPNTVWGGAEFSMELVEVRTAKSAYDPNKQKKEEKTEHKNNPVLEVGAKVVFKGGSVYVSSDAKKAAANRERQTCKITKISTKSWSVHQYHLISTEKKYPHNVYGWVDKANIEGTTGTPTKTGSVTNAGIQQVTPNKSTVKLWALKTTSKEVTIDYVGTKDGAKTLKLTIDGKQCVKTYDSSLQIYVYFLFSAVKTEKTNSKLYTKAYRCYVPKGATMYCTADDYKKVQGGK